MSPDKTKKLNILRKKLDLLDNKLIKLIKINTLRNGGEYLYVSLSKALVERKLQVPPRSKISKKN